MTAKNIFLTYILTLYCLILLPAGYAAAADNGGAGDAAIDTEAASQFELDAIIVTASKVQEPVADVPKHVTVISKEDIAASSAKNIMDVLSLESGINIRSASGNDKQAVVDLRGMGDTAASNVIVMVDDLVLNSPDQSGPSISSIPLEQIDRIEIVRGAGSVIYGNGAVGGVINIITKKPEAEPSMNLYASYGRYDTYDSRVSCSSSIKNLFLNLNAGIYDSDEYRDNGFLKKNDIQAKSIYKFNERFSAGISGSYYEDEYGLPGPVDKNDINSASRRVKTDRPNDHGDSSDTRGRLEFNADFEKWGLLNFKRGYIVRHDTYIIGYNPQISESDQQDKIDENTRQLDLNYIKNYTLCGYSHMLQLGIDDYQSDYIREEKPDGPRKNSDTQSSGIFVNNQWQAGNQLTINAGIRYNHYKGRFRTDLKKTIDGTKYWINGDAQKREWNNQAYSLGGNYVVSPNLIFFGSYATSFRIPNVDEFAESEPGIKPQEGKHFEFGYRQRFASLLYLTVTLFDIRIDDEIYYNDINRNYDDRTIRQGVETELTVSPADDVRLWGNYTYTKAEFENLNTTMPLVPQHRASAGINWQMFRQWNLSMSGTYIGSQYDGNDIHNDRYDKIDDAVVFDTKLTYEFKKVTVFAGINNLFNELYATSGYSESYYPMPGRSIYGGIRWTCF